MNTKQIDYCIELAHTLNFSRAADNLFVRREEMKKAIEQGQNFNIPEGLKIFEK